MKELEKSPYVSKWDVEYEFNKDGSLKTKLIIYANIPLSNLQANYNDQKFQELVETGRQLLDGPTFDTVSIVPIPLK